MITVAVSQGAAEDHVLAGDSLPRSYSYVVDDELSTPIEPILLWLCSSYPPRRGMWRPATVEAAAYDLCDWWRFLEHEHRPWGEVTSDDLARYRDGLLIAVSPHRKTPYDPRTVGRRVRSVGNFYEWAGRRGYFFGEPVSRKPLKLAVRRLDDDALAHTGAAIYRSVQTLAPRQNSSPDDRLHPLTPDEWRRVAAALGPLPCQRADGAPGLSRDRLAAEVSLWTGLRVDEVAGLTAAQIVEVAARITDSSTGVVELTRTKGLRRRKVLFPSHLIKELMAYIDDEREDAIANGRRYGLTKAPPGLFVNGLASRNHAGRPVKAYTLSENFRRAVCAAGMMRSSERIDPVRRNGFVMQTPAHTFHDLRHTFAVFLYQAEVASGNREPWKIIQARLGHKHLRTTVDTYLRIVDIFRIKTNDIVYRYLRANLGA